MKNLPASEARERRAGRRWPPLVGFVLVLVILATAAWRTPEQRSAAHERDERVIQSERADSNPEQPALASLDWLAGHWRQRTARGWTEELWLPAEGELMVGVNRSLEHGRERARFEFLRIERTADGIVYHASPGGGPAVAFRLIELEPRRVVFANPEHDFPTHIEYRLTEADRLVAAIRGAEPGPSWTFERQRASD